MMDFNRVIVSLLCLVCFEFGVVTLALVAGVKTDFKVLITSLVMGCMLAYVGFCFALAWLVKEDGREERV